MLMVVLFVCLVSVVKLFSVWLMVGSVGNCLCVWFIILILLYSVGNKLMVLCCVGGKLVVIVCKVGMFLVVSVVKRLF